MSTHQQPGRFGKTVSPVGISEEQRLDDPLIGRTLEGRFEIREQLGEGGMGTVYRAYQSSIDREVAVKVVRPEHGNKPIAVKRFMREARLASQVSHPNLVVIHDFGHTHDGLFFLVMELVEGNTLQEELRSQEGMALERFLRIGEQLCAAVAAAHHEGIVHRDIKPSNVMLDARGSKEIAKVLDFGLARSTTTSDVRLTASQQQVGTPLYMAPEMIRAEPIDGRTDLYQLGCTLYEMATGAPPFTANTVEMLYALHLEHLPPVLRREGLGPLCGVIMSMLAKDPQRRPQTIDEVHGLFEARLTEHLASGSRPARGPSQRRRLLLGLGATLIAATAVALVVVPGFSGRGVQTTPKAVGHTSLVASDADLTTPVRDAPVVQPRVVQLTASPKAIVLRDGEVLGKTPMDFTIEENLATTLEFQAEGHQTQTKKVDATSPPALDVTLHKLATPKPERRRRKPPRPAKPDMAEPEPEAPKPEPSKPDKPEAPVPVFRLKQ